MNDIRIHCYCYCTSPGRSKTSINWQGFYNDIYPNTEFKDQFGTVGWWSLCIGGVHHINVPITGKDLI